MKMTAKVTVSVFFIILMVGTAYAWDDDVWSGGYPPIWQIFKKGKVVRWVDWKDNRRFANYDPATPNDPSDDMVLDKETGLVWERSPSTTDATWLDANYDCNNRKVGNSMGWRLPTLQELASLMDPSVPSPGPKLPSGHPFVIVLQSFYWTTTANPNFATLRWFVSFNNGDVQMG